MQVWIIAKADGSRLIPRKHTETLVLLRIALRVSLLKTDYFSLSDTHAKDSGSICENICMFYWSGNQDGEQISHGAGITVQSMLLNCVHHPVTICLFLMTMRVRASTGHYLSLRITSSCCTSARSRMYSMRRSGKLWASCHFEKTEESLLEIWRTQWLWKVTLEWLSSSREHWLNQWEY